jgi:hypothetical protein
MLIGYVSDETYSAVPDVVLDFEQNQELISTCRSSARGAIHADIPPGHYTVSLNKTGYGAKAVQVEIAPGRPLQFRLLSDSLLGFIWPKWVKSGETGEFRVHSPEPYRISLWRYGVHKEMASLVGWFDEHGPRSTIQVTPDGDYTQTGVRWNKVGFAPSVHSQAVVAPERSGLYYVHAETESGRFFAFPWVVAPAKPSAPVAVLAATNTWNAYNAFGGRSNYVLATGLPARPIVYGRQDLPRFNGKKEWSDPMSAYLPLSFERPEPNNGVRRDDEADQPMRGRMTSALSPADWRLLAWLERGGWDYDYYSDSQLHSGQLDLDAYRVLILTCHPEYWTRAMYERVKSWVYERGGRLMYLGGNGINCEVELLEDSRMVCKTELRAEGESLGMWHPDKPGVWFESRFQFTVESEARLLGVVTTAPGLMTSAPYRAVEPSHWIFAGTNLNENDLFGFRSLHERCSHGASGHETDKMFAPATPPGTVLLAKGINANNGGSEMVYYETASGGAVFSVGSITYPACLLVDETISHITNNVLSRFAAAPEAGHADAHRGS